MTEVTDDLTEELFVNGELGEEGEIPPPPRNRRRRNLVIAAVVVVAAGAATGLSLWLTGGTPTAGLVVKTEKVTVTRGTIQQTVATSGTIEPASQSNLNFTVSGVVTAVDVQAGQTVAAGAVLATVGTSALQADLDAAEAQLTSAQDRLSSDESSDASTSTIDSDEASVTSAESSLTTAQTNLTDASLTSPIAGTVASVSLTVGQQVTGSGGGGGEGAANANASDGSDSSSAQVVVIGTNSYQVSTTVDDTEIGEIQNGDQATIVPSGSSTTVYGTVSSIGIIASSSSDVASFPVTVSVTGSPSGLYAGSSANVSIIVKQLNNVVEVPTAALSYTSGGQATVTEVVDGHDVTKDVTVGEAENGETQIVSGVTAGDRILEKVITFQGGATTGGGGIFGGTGSGGFPGGGARKFFGGGGGGTGGGTFNFSPAGGG